MFGGRPEKIRLTEKETKLKLKMDKLCSVISLLVQECNETREELEASLNSRDRKEHPEKYCQDCGNAVARTHCV